MTRVEEVGAGAQRACLQDAASSDSTRGARPWAPLVRRWWWGRANARPAASSNLATTARRCLALGSAARRQCWGRARRPHVARGELGVGLPKLDKFWCSQAHYCFSVGPNSTCACQVPYSHAPRYAMSSGSSLLLACACHGKSSNVPARLQPLCHASSTVPHVKGP